MMENLKTINEYLPDGVGSAVLKTMCNAWPTGIRFKKTTSGTFCSRKNNPCLVCGKNKGDQQLHYLECAVFTEAIQKIFPHYEPPCGKRSTIERFCMTTARDTQGILADGIVCDAILKTYNAIRTGMSPSKLANYMKARLRFWSNNHPRTYGAVLRNMAAGSANHESLFARRRTKNKHSIAATH